MNVYVLLLSHVQLFATPWTVAHQASLSMGFFRQGYWSGLPLLTPGDLLDPSLPHRQAGSSLLSHLGIPSDGTELHCVSPDVLY